MIDVIIFSPCVNNKNAYNFLEAPEIIGNTSGKGFMRQSGPNSLTPSQIINLEEEVQLQSSRKRTVLITLMIISYTHIIS